MKSFETQSPRQRHTKQTKPFPKERSTEDSGDLSQEGTTLQNSGNSLSKVPLSLKIFFVVYMLFIISDLFFHNEYRSSSCYITRYFQGLSTSIIPISKFLSREATYWYPIFFLVQAFYTSNLRRYLHSLMGLVLPTIIMIFLKGAYARPRPHFECSGFEYIKCSSSYGMPSGHTAFALAVYYTIWRQLFQKSKNQFLKVTSFILFFLFALCIAASRIALGVHSWNQIVAGFGLSMLCLYFTFYYITEDILFNFITKTSKLVWIFLTVGVSILGLICHFFNLNNQRFPDNQHSQKCPNHNLNLLRFQNVNWIIVTAPFIICLGFKVNSQLTPENSKKIKISLNIQDYLLRTLLNLACFVPSAVIFGITRKFPIFDMTKFETMHFVFFRDLIAVLIGFWLIPFFPVLVLRIIGRDRKRDYVGLK